MGAVLIYAIEREGDFSVHAKDYRAQCGRRGQTVGKYRILVEGNKPGKHGFLLDNNSIPLYFEQQYRHARVFPSCEEIAAKAVLHFRTMCEHNGAVLTKVCARISVIKDSWISAEWRVGL